MNKSNDSANQLSSATLVRKSLRSLLQILAALCVCSCASLGLQPNNADVQAVAPTVVDLTTVKLGRAYIKAVKDDMAARRDKMTNTDLALGGAILGGFVALGDGAIGNWNSRTMGRLGIFSAAMVGVQSSLSLKTQAAIMNKGIATLNCIEEQADVAWGPLLPFDAYVDSVSEQAEEVSRAVADIRGALSANKGGSIRQRLEMEAWLFQIESDLSEARAWIKARNNSVVIVNSGVKNAVNKVVQVTVDNLASVLPDGSAFAKIGSSLPKVSPLANQAAPRMGSADESPKEVAELTNEAISRDANLKGALAISNDDANLISGKAIRVSNLQKRLAAAIRAADRNIAMLGAPPSTHSPTISCNVETVFKPLSLSNLSSLIVSGSAGAAWVTIEGGKPPYTNPPRLTGASSSQKPEEIRATVVDSLVILNSSANVPIGTYVLQVSDAAGTERSLQFLVLGRPSIENQMQDQTVPVNKPIRWDFGATFKDPQEQAMTYKVTGLPDWLRSDNKNPPTLSGAPGAAHSAITISVTATNASGLITEMKFKVAVQ